MHKQGDIVLMPLPFTNLMAQKRRPVLVLSNNKYNETTDDLIVAAITSVLDAKPYSVLFSNRDMAEGMLKTDSCIRADKIYTMSQDIVLKRFGRVKSEIVDDVIRKLFEIIGTRAKEAPHA